MSRLLPCLVMVSVLLSIPAYSQITMRPTPPPRVSADAEPWYLSRQPILLDGNLYYPTGPVVHFAPHEMVRTGWMDGVPIYIRTTREPRSVIYVPLAGGLVRPYERRRDGDLAGTVGSTAPSFPVVLPAAERIDPDPRRGRAPAPPTGHRVSALGFVREHPPARVTATTGVQATPPPDGPVLRSARPPEGLNAIFVEYEGTRWLAAGPVVRYDAARFQAVGDHAGFVVYAEPGRADVIYIPVVDGPPGLVTPYRSYAP